MSIPMNPLSLTAPTTLFCENLLRTYRKLIIILNVLIIAQGRDDFDRHSRCGGNYSGMCADLFVLPSRGLQEGVFCRSQLALFFRVEQ